jgi:hypothetical protein
MKNTIKLMALATLVVGALACDKNMHHEPATSETVAVDTAAPAPAPASTTDTTATVASTADPAATSATSAPSTTETSATTATTATQEKK